MKKGKEMENINFPSLHAKEIVNILEAPTDDRRPLTHKLKRYAAIKELVVALQISQTELTRRILCNILGARRAKSAIPVLLECLDDPSPSVKDDAAEALGKIGSIKAGEALLNHFESNPRIWFAIALGAIGYRAAIPALINGLSSSSAKVRGGSAWSLGELKVNEARKPLEDMLAKEQDEFALDRIREALKAIRATKKRQQTGS
jgi:HEAT repeat protein